MTTHPRRITFRMTETEYQAVVRQAEEEKVTVSEIVHGRVFDRFVAVKQPRRRNPK